MEEKDLKTLIETGLDKVKAEVAEKTKGIEGFEAKAQKMVADLEAKMNTAKADEIEALKKDFNERLDGIVATMKAKNNNKVVYKSFGEAFMEALNEEKENLQGHIENQKSSKAVNLEIKAPVSIGLSNTIEAVGSDSQVSITENTGIISPLRKRLLTYLQAVGSGSISTAKAMWIEELDEQGAVIPTAELATKPQLSVRFEERDRKVVKYPAFSKVSTEMLADAPQLLSYVQNNLLRRIMIKVEDDLFAGDGIGENLLGLTEIATAFTGGSLAATLPPASANDYDVIEAVALQVYEAFGEASALFIDAGKLAALRLNKDADGNYIMPPFSSADGTTISGVRLIPATGLTARTTFDFVGGDLSVVNVLFRQGLTVQIDKDGNDFINNQRTLLAELRLVQFASANDAQVLVKGTFAAAKTALNGV